MMIMMLKTNNIHIDNSRHNVFAIGRNFGEEIYIARKLLSLTKSHLYHKFIVNGIKKKNAKVTCFVLVSELK